MILNEGGREEFAEPVGIAHLCIAEVVSASLRRVLQSEDPRRGVVVVRQVVHLPVDTRGAVVVDAGEVQPALTLHLVVDLHLVLRVHDIVVAVAGHEARGELPCVGEGAATRVTLLRRDDDDPCHSLCPVDGRCRAVLEDLEALDIVGIETCDSRAEECRSVPRAEVISADVYDILLDDPVDDPEGLGRTHDRGRPTHTDLRCCTEGPREVLHGDPCGLPFETAADVSHTSHLHLVGLELVARPREEALVGSDHTRDDDIVEGGGFGLELDDHTVLSRDGLALVAHEADEELVLASRELDGEVTLGVSRDTHLRPND